MKFNLPMILRRTGVLILLAAGASFLFDGWHVLTPFAKYLYFCSFTAVLTAMGLFCVMRLNETKGARTFLGLAAASLSAHFAQLGAFIYSWDHADLKMVVGASVAVLLTVPVAYLGFAGFQRTVGKNLWVAYLVLNAFLLFPIRQGTEMAMLLLGAFALFIRVNYVESKKLEMRTSEGTLARLTLSIPLLVLFCRTFMYAQTDYVTGMLFLIAGTLFLRAGKSFDQLEPHTGILQFISAPLFSLGVFHFTEPLGFHFHYDYRIYFSLLPQALALTGFSFLAANAEAGRALRKLGSTLSVLILLFALWIVSAPLAAVITIAFGLLFIAGGFTAQDRSLVIGGTTCLGAGLIHQVWASIALFLHSPWVSLALLGVGTLLAAVYLEKNADLVTFKFRAARQRFSDWK